MLGGIATRLGAPDRQGDLRKQVSCSHGPSRYQCASPCSAHQLWNL